MFYPLVIGGVALIWGDEISDAAQKEFARAAGLALARKYGQRLGADSDDAFRDKFNHMWDLTWRAKTYAEDHHDPMITEVTDNLAGLSILVTQADKTNTGIWTRREVADARSHLKTYRTLPANDRCVILSDIHMTDAANRQNFFEWTNKQLYLDVLRSFYAPKGYTLIENGDVEELLIFEPDPVGMPDFAKDDWPVILADRDRRMKDQFLRILTDHADYYQLINDLFIRRGAFFRTIGNHDTVMATSAYVDDIKRVLGIDFPRASDAVLLTSDGGVTDLICHGHQFDAYCSAQHARYAGESFSQGGAWAFQGPDRFWSQQNDAAAFIDPWHRGEKGFANALVSDDPAAGDQVWTALRKTAAEALNWLTSPFDDAAAALGMDDFLNDIGGLHKTAQWEALYDKNIAWDYFRAPDPQVSYDQEVKTGERWYKYRHMDEISIVAAMDAHFGADGLRLVLGHSHEPRLNPARPGLPGQPVQLARNYVNTAAAGRFENMIWAVEYNDGVPELVSWSRNATTAKLERAHWTPQPTGVSSMLLATARDQVAVVAPASAARTSAAFTHMIFA